MTQSPRHAIVWSVLNALGTKGTNFVVYLVLARALGPNAFGIVALGLALTGFLEIVCEHKFSAILIQQEQLSEIEKSSVFYFQVAGGLVSALLVTCASGLLGRLFAEPRLTSVLPWLALAMLVNTTTYVQEALLKRALKFKVLTLRSMSANLFGGAVGIVMALAGFGVSSMISMLLCSALAGAAVLWFTSGWRPMGAFSMAAFMPMYRSARYIASTAIAGAGVLPANMFIVGYFFGTNVAGFYAFALRIYDVLMRVTTFSLSDAAFPIFSRKTADLADYRSAFVRLIGAAGAVTVGLLMIVGALSPTIIHLFFGSQWAGASKYLQIYLIAGAIISIGAYTDVTLLAFGKTRSVALAYFAGLVLWSVQLPLLVFFGPLFPALSWCVTQAVLFPVKARWALRLMQMPVRDYLRMLYPVLGAGAAAGVAVAAVQYFAGARSIMALVGGLTVGPVVFVFAVVSLGTESLPVVWRRLGAFVRRR